MLNKMFMIAILMGVLACSKVIVALISCLKGFIKIEKTMTVAKLNIRLKCASFLASLLEFTSP